jgi:hypothetical protein
MHIVLQWVDNTEQWILSLAYGFQVALVLVVLFMIAMVVVRVLTLMIDRVGDRLHPVPDSHIAHDAACHAVDEGTR